MRTLAPDPARDVAPAAVDRSFGLMGTHMRVVVGAAVASGAPSPEVAADRVQDLLADYDRRLSRFKPDSELVALNADPRTTVPASGLLRDAVRVAVETAARTHGLIDPTVLDELEAAGYTESWDPDRRIELTDALRISRAPRRPAAPAGTRRWADVVVDDAAGTITRPPGVRLDTGGTGKGHAADLAAALLEPYDAWAVDCGGDLRLGGRAGLVRDVEIEHPFTGETCEVVRVRDGAVATSGLRSRIWRTAGGDVAHHLLDPSTGAPAFTGLVAASAIAPTAALAEALAKTALLCGPDRARTILGRHGGIAVTDDGTLIRAGRLDAVPRIRFTTTSREMAA